MRTVTFFLITLFLLLSIAVGGAEFFMLLLAAAGSATLTFALSIFYKNYKRTEDLKKVLSESFKEVSSLVRNLLKGSDSGRQ